MNERWLPCSNTLCTPLGKSDMGTFSCMPFKTPNESLSSTIKEACSCLYVEDVNFVERGFVVFVRCEGRPGQIDGTLLFFNIFFLTCWSFFILLLFFFFFFFSFFFIYIFVYSK